MEHELDGNKVVMYHPVSYESGMFKGSQMNFVVLTKEACISYMSIKKLAYYLEAADVMLKSDHLPLKKFLQKITLNMIVKGIKNTL